MIDSSATDPDTTVQAPDSIRPRLGYALGRALSQGYGASDLRSDLGAGLVVGIVAVPLSMALAIAAGVAPQHGLYTAIVAGSLIALLGGSRTQVSGPTAAFVAILAPIATRFGVGGLLVATALAGVLLILLGLARMGRLIEFVPHPVTTGFTAGIALVIASLQLEDFLGLHLTGHPEGFAARVSTAARALPTAHLPDLLMGAGTLAVLLLAPRLVRRVPAPLIALPLAGLAAAAAAQVAPELGLETLGTRFTYATAGGLAHGVPQLPPLPLLPWTLPGPDGQPLGLSLGLLRELLPSAFAIAMLGAIESLLSAVVADGMTGHRHHPDSELLAQGIGNLVAPFFGGIAATGALARTATNVRSGGRSPIAAAFHAVVVLAAILVLAPLLAHLPMASLAALLLVVAWNMSETRQVLHLLRSAPRSDILTLITCFTLTVVFDMVVAVSVGIVLAALLFMRRMAEVSGVMLLGERHRPPTLPADVVVYQIAGPLFFGAAHKAMAALGRVAPGTRTVLFDLRAVPALDATGLMNLELAVHRLQQAGTRVVLAGTQDQPFRALLRAGFRHRSATVRLYRSFDQAVQALSAVEPTPPASPH
jgi:SulP family sulfate permease